jgi:hypothetical protein
MGNSPIAVQAKGAPALISLTTTQIPKATMPTEITNESTLSILAPFQRAQVSPGKPSLKDASGDWFREILRALHESSGVDHRIRSANAFVEIDDFAQIRTRIDPTDTAAFRAL